MTQLRSQICIGDSVPSLTSTYSKVLCVSIGSTTLATQPFISNNHSILFSGRGRSYGRSRSCGRDSEETTIVVVETQVVIEDFENVIIAIRKITHLYTARRSIEKQNGRKL